MDIEFESFIATVRPSGSGSLEITIPDKICKFSGIIDGTNVRVMIKKVSLLEEEKK